MAEQETEEKKIPEEISGRFDLDSLVKKQRNTVRLEMFNSMPKLIEKALENPSGTFQLVNDEQTAILHRIDENILFFKEQLGELSDKIKKNKDKGEKEDKNTKDSIWDGSIPRLIKTIKKGGTKELLGGYFGEKIKKNIEKKAKLKAAASDVLPNLQMPDVSHHVPEGTIIKDPKHKGSQYIDAKTQRKVKKSLGEKAEKAGKVITRDQFNEMKKVEKPTATPIVKPAKVSSNVLQMPDVKPPPTGGGLLDKLKDKVVNKVEKSVITKAVTKIIGSKVGKLVAKAIPGVGALAALGYSINRAAAGDFTGAMGEIGGGVASLFPGPGTAVAVASDVALGARDVYESVYGVLPEQDPNMSSRFSDIYDSVKDYISSFISGGDTGKTAIEPPAGAIPNRTGERETAVEKVEDKNNNNIQTSSQKTDTAVIQPFAASADRRIPEAPSQEETIANVNAAAISNVMDVKMAEFGEKMVGRKNTPTTPGGASITVPSFVSPPIPTALGVVAMRAQGLADVYPHPMSGPTMQNGDRGGETIFQ